MTSEQISKAIFYLVPNAEFAFTEADLTTLEWHMKDVPQPTIEEITAAIPKAEAAEKTQLKEQEKSKQAILDRLGLTTDEVALLLK